MDGQINEGINYFKDGQMNEEESNKGVCEWMDRRIYYVLKCYFIEIILIFFNLEILEYVLNSWNIR